MFKHPLESHKVAFFWCLYGCTGDSDQRGFLQEKTWYGVNGWCTLTVHIFANLDWSSEVHISAWERGMCHQECAFIWVP